MRPSDFRVQTRGVRLQPPHVDAGMLCVREARDYLRGGSVCLFHVSCVITTVDAPAMAPLSTLFREAVDLKGAERGSTY